MLLLLAAEPSPEALKLGREVAETGTLASLLPVLSAQAVDELGRDHSDLSPADQKALRESAERTARAGNERILNETAQSYAKRLTVDELRSIAEFSRTAEARRLREVTPAAIAETMQALGKLDFKANAIANFCKETGKLCPAK
jgi:hypothetical protein